MVGSELWIIVTNVFVLVPPRLTLVNFVSSLRMNRFHANSVCVCTTISHSAQVAHAKMDCLTITRVESRSLSGPGREQVILFLAGQ